MKFVLKLLLFQFLITKIFAEPIRINAEDYQILNQFFRITFINSEYGYVLDGSKPVSQMTVPPIESLIAPKNFNFQTGVLAREAIKVWKKLAPKQKDFFLKISEINNEEFSTPFYELAFINRKKLKETIQNNIDLFRYVLGPTMDADQLTEYIIKSEESLDCILHNDKVLVGIVLGFGSYNSLMHSRAEEIQNAQSMNDIAPFSLRSHLMHHQGVVQWNEAQLKTLFLAQAGSKNLSDRCENRPFIPGLGFTEAEEELNYIFSAREDISKDLANERPKFIFGAYKNADNQKLMKNLKRSQQKIVSLLAKKNFLESVLEKITGEVPIVTQVRMEDKIHWVPLNKNSEKAIAHILWEMTSELDPETVSEFVDAFCRGDASEIKRGPAMIPGSMGGLKRALSNLEFAETWFSTVPKEKMLTEILPSYLYFEKEKNGTGKVVDGHDRLFLSYVIEDGYGNTLSANHNCWIKLSSTIPGFAHGVTGMREGEKRILYIHPALAYGALTTLPSCLLLVAKVTVHEIPEQPKIALPPLQPVDLSWLKDPNFYQEIEKGNYQFAKTFGSRWGSWIKQSADLDFSTICAHLKELESKKSPINSSEENGDCCNRVFWNLVAAEI